MNDESQTPDNADVPAPTRWWRQPRKLLPVNGVLVIVIAAAGAIAYSELKRPEDVKNSSVPFVEPTIKKKPKKAKDNTVAWPTFRYDRQRTGYLPVKGIVPPFKRLWKY